MTKKKEQKEQKLDSKGRPINNIKANRHVCHWKQTGFQTLISQPGFQKYKYSYKCKCGETRTEIVTGHLPHP